MTRLERALKDWRELDSTLRRGVRGELRRLLAHFEAAAKANHHEVRTEYWAKLANGMKRALRLLEESGKEQR